MQFDTQYSKLKNGVRVLLVPMQGVESVTTMILVKTGSRNETAEQAGISHVLEHMVFKGTKKYPTPMAIAEAVDGIGAEQNAFTSKEYTGYYITSAAKHLPLALDIQSQMLTMPLIPSADLEREREVIVEEINMYEDQPMAKAGEEFENLMYAGSSLGREIIGTKETVRATTSEHLRAYLARWYRGSNVLVVVAGRINNQATNSNNQTNSNDQIIKLIEDKLGVMQPGDIDPYESVGGYGQPQAKHVKKKTEQAHFYIGVPGLSMHDPRRYAFQMAQVVLGGGMSSRLFNEIREKRGLAYYVRSELDMTFDTGYMAVRAGVNLAQLSEAMSVVREEMFKLGSTITAAELTKAKEYVLGRLPLSLEESMGVAQFFGTRALIKDEVVQPSQVVESVQAVTMDQVRGICEELIKDTELRSVVVGPKAS